MTGAIRSELRKFFTTRLWWGMGIGVVLSGALFAGLFAFFLTADLSGDNAQGVPTGSPTQLANSVYTAGLQIGYLLLLTIGILTIGAEYRHKTITSTFLAVPRRGVVMGAKVVSLLIIGALYGLASLAGSVLVGAITLSARGREAFPSADVARSLLLSLLVLGLWALIGLGVGILIPNQVAAVLIGVGTAWIAEPLLTFALTFWTWGREHLVPYFPSSATNAIVNGVTNSEGAQPLVWWAAALVLMGYAALLAGFGTWRTVRRDVS